MLLCITCSYSGTAVGVVVYTGRETRSVLNTSQPRAKVCTVHRVILYMHKYLQTVHNTVHTYAQSLPHTCCMIYHNCFKINCVMTKFLIASVIAFMYVYIYIYIYIYVCVCISLLISISIPGWFT